MTINVKDYVALGDGITDDTAAIQQAVDSLAALGGGTLFFLEGRYLVTNTINVPSSVGITLSGDDRKSSEILVGSTSADIFNITGNFVSIKSLGFIVPASMTRTAGTFVTLAGDFNAIDDFHMDKDFIGIKSSGVSNRITNGIMQTGAANGTRIIISGGDKSQIIDNVLIGSQNSPFPKAGINVQSAAALTISNTSVINQGIDLLIDPISGFNVAHCFIHDCFFDTAATGVSIKPSGAGIVTNINFVNVWASSHTGSGVAISTADGGNVDGITLVNPQLRHNGIDGITLTGAPVNINVVGGHAGGNTGAGFNATGSSIGFFSLNGFSSGAVYGVPGNQYGIRINPAASNYVISNCITQSNTIKQISGLSSVGKVIDNLGISTRKTGSSSIPTGNTSVVVSHGLDLTPLAQDIFLSFTSNVGATPLYVDPTTITATQFTVKSSIASSALSFVWSASCCGN